MLRFSVIDNVCSLIHYKFYATNFCWLLNDFVCHYVYFQFANKNRISIHVSLTYSAYNGTKDGQLQYANFSCNSYFVIHARNCSCQMFFWNRVWALKRERTPVFDEDTLLCTQFFPRNNDAITLMLTKVWNSF